MASWFFFLLLFVGWIVNLMCGCFWSMFLFGWMTFGSWNYFGNCIEFKVTLLNTISVPFLSHCACIEILFANSHIYELIFNFSYVFVFL